MDQAQITLASKILSKALREDEDLWKSYKTTIAAAMLDAYIEHNDGTSYTRDMSKIYEDVYKAALYGADRWLTQMTKTS